MAGHYWLFRVLEVYYQSRRTVDAHFTIISVPQRAATMCTVIVVWDSAPAPPPILQRKVKCYPLLRASENGVGVSATGIFKTRRWCCCCVVFTAGKSNEVGEDPLITPAAPRNRAYRCAPPTPPLSTPASEESGVGAKPKSYPVVVDKPQSSRHLQT